MSLYKPFDIVFVPFPYEEDFDTAKPRPVMILSKPDERGYFPAAKITSSPASFRFRIYGGPPSNLQHDSWLDMTRIERFHITDVMFSLGVFPDDLKTDLKRYLLRASEIKKNNTK